MSSTIVARALERSERPLSLASVFCLRAGRRALLRTPNEDPPMIIGIAPLPPPPKADSKIYANSRVISRLPDEMTPHHVNIELSPFRQDQRHLRLATHAPTLLCSFPCFGAWSKPFCQLTRQDTILACERFSDVRSETVTRGPPFLLSNEDGGRGTTSSDGLGGGSGEPWGQGPAQESGGDEGGHRGDIQGALRVDETH